MYCALRCLGSKGALAECTTCAPMSVAVAIHIEALPHAYKKGAPRTHLPEHFAAVVVCQDGARKQMTSTTAVEVGCQGTSSCRTHAVGR